MGYELVPAYIRVQARTENILPAYANWLTDAWRGMTELNWVSDETENWIQAELFNPTYESCNRISALLHRDMYNNDMKLTGLSFKNQAGKYLNMVQKDDPLSGFSPYNTDYSLGNTPDNITLQYSRLGAMLTVSVEVPQGVMYDSATGAISGLEGKKGKIDIKVENTELYKHTIYTVYFDNTVLPQVDFAAYLPGYGQFVNEYINDGGWGDAYLVGTTGRKNMLNHIESTGVSLGSFGGYAIFDFGVDGIKNDPKNKYGVDFIAYGNAFVGNSEPGGIQVSADGTNWYNIAGSRHYADSTVWDYTVEHTNPIPADDGANLVNPQGQLPSANHIFPTISKARPESAEQPGTYKITHNTWHNHSWYPLFANYFKSRKDGDLPLANLTLSQKFATYTPKAGNTASKIKLKGTKIDFTSMQAADYTFGYCDVHPNGSNYGVAANPYVATGSTQGGDGIDISWAVDANGAPVHLDAIRYVRIYTGVMKDNPPFGETSTEVCGVYNVNPQASAVGVTAAPIVKKGPQTITHTNGGIQTVATKPNGQINLKFTSQSENVYVNGVKVNASGSGYQINMTLNPQEVKYLQVIAQTGDKEPYVTVFKIVRN